MTDACSCGRPARYDCRDCDRPLCIRHSIAVPVYESNFVRFARVCHGACEDHFEPRHDPWWHVVLPMLGAAVALFLVASVATCGAGR